MKRFLLTKIRLTWFFVGFFILFLALSLVLPQLKFDAAALTLFSVNSFLYGFYIAPVLGAQKARIEELHRIVRAEANNIFSMVLTTKKLPKHLRNEVQEGFSTYMKASLRDKRVAEGEDEYEALIKYCLDYKGEHQEEVDKILAGLIANQQQRAVMGMQLRNKVYSNEWMIMLVLFSITLGFILLLEIGNEPILHVVKALLCTGLTMLIINLVKLSTLTHKKSKEVWQPLEKLLASHFYRMD